VADADRGDRQPFQAFFQTDRYTYEWERDGDVVREPVRRQRVRALIAEPTDGASVTAGALVVRSVAWSGAAPIDRVDVSIGGGPWQPARLIGERRRYSWQWWELLTRYETHGPCTVRAQATDLAGRTQPERPDWNRLGYGGNAIQTVAITVRRAARGWGRSEDTGAGIASRRGKSGGPRRRRPSRR
jgi:hypothetical protein